MEQSRDRGPSSITGFKGLVNFAAGIATGDIITGLEAAKDVFNHRLIVSVDPGLVYTAGLTFSVGEIRDEFYSGDFAKKLISAKSISQATGLKDYIAARNVESAENSDLIDELAKQHGRTMDLSDYQAHSDHFEATTDHLLRSHNSRQSRRNHARLQSQKQRYWSNIVNLIFAMNDEMNTHSEKAPVILFGNGSFGNVKGCLPGNAAWLRQYLARFFTVIVVDEYNSSQKCPMCFGQLEMHEPAKGVRVKRCTKCTGGGPGGKFVVNRDVAAGMNFVSIVLISILSGKRPPEFSPITRF